MLDQETLEATIGFGGTMSDGVLKMSVPRNDSCLDCRRHSGSNLILQQHDVAHYRGLPGTFAEGCPGSQAHKRDDLKPVHRHL
jgi:hypothetical protein